MVSGTYACNSEVLNIFQTEGQSRTRLSTRGPLVYKWGQFIETSQQFINNVSNLLL
jgi:hypothetical protein